MKLRAIYRNEQAFSHKHLFKSFIEKNPKLLSPVSSLSFSKKAIILRIAEENPDWMSRSRLPNKLQPAKKALKRLANTLQTKLQNLSFSRAIKVIRTNTSRILEYCSLHFFLPFKKRLLARAPLHRQQRYNQIYRPYSNRNQHTKSTPAIYIDQLYAAERGTVDAKHFHSQAETSCGKKVIDQKTLQSKEGKKKEKTLYSIEDAWREVVAKSPQLRPVDERAEEFICKFRQDMKLQKDRSLIEFEEMLARSA